VRHTIICASLFESPEAFTSQSGRSVRIDNDAQARTMLRPPFFLFQRVIALLSTPRILQ
jgi:hypothetical protein